MTDEETKSGVSRRQFITGAVGSAAVLGAVAGLTSLVPPVAAISSGKSPAAATGALGTAGAAQASTVPTNWTHTTDVVVVGYGSAGAVAAMTAFDTGANVLIVEKTPSLASLGITSGPNDATQISGGGGNSHICGGEGGWYLKDPVQGANWIYAMSLGETPLSTCQAFASMIATNRAWMDAMGIPYTPATTATNPEEFGPLGLAAGIYSLSIAGNGQGGFHIYDQMIQKRGIPILFNCRATDLVQNPTTKEILGVRALQNMSEVVNIKAKRGVILTTGGFEHNALMKLEYLKMHPYHYGGWQYNTGDGIPMAQKVGAGLWHMTCTSGRAAPWIPTYNMAWAIQTNGKYNYIWTDRYGKRYTKETGLPGHSAMYTMTEWSIDNAEYSRVPSLMIFDETVRKAGPVAVGEGGQNIRTGINALPIQLGGTMDVTKPPPSTATYAPNSWSLDNMTEINAGYIIQGSDLPTLAANIAKAKIIGSNQGMAVPAGWNSIESMDNVTLPGGSNCPNFSAANLQAAVNQFNADCAAGKGDTVFGRTAATMAPVQTPPFYAMPLWPAGPNTNGGPIRNEKAQVCDPDWKPIPRLYSGGEFGSWWGLLYQGGGNLTESIASGRISGNNAANEVPWTT